MGQSELKNEASPLPNSVSNTLNCGQQIPTTKLTRRAMSAHQVRRFAVLIADVFGMPVAIVALAALTFLSGTVVAFIMQN